ncbi:MAG: GNAT family N-acetyltransferase [Gammaproteobacteria bacterium]|nr:GNAT family N-acetyltransferase [Gammaproteobacteria bacterium]
MPDSELIIRYGQLADAAILAYFGEQCFRARYGPENKSEDLEAYVYEAFSAEHVSAEFADPKAIFLLGHVGEDLVVYAKLLSHKPPEGVGGKKPVELERLYTAPTHIGEGFGSEMLDFAMEEARHQGFDMMWLDVWEHNDEAIRFYARHGFEECGTCTFTLGDDKQTNTVMCRRVD